MSVNRVSFVFHFALKNAGMNAQIAPAATPAIAMMTMSSQFGTESPMSIMQAATASDPASTWPSAPMVPEPHLERRGDCQRYAQQYSQILQQTQVLRFVPKAALEHCRVYLYRVLTVKTIVTTAQTMRASIMAAALIAQALYQGARPSWRCA